MLVMIIFPIRSLDVPMGSIRTFYTFPTFKVKFKCTRFRFGKKDKKRSAKMKLLKLQCVIVLFWADIDSAQRLILLGQFGILA